MLEKAKKLQEVLEKINECLLKEDLDTTEKLTDFFDKVRGEYDAAEAEYKQAKQNTEQEQSIESEIAQLFTSMRSTMAKNAELGEALAASYKQEIKQINAKRKAEMQYGAPQYMDPIYVDKTS